MLFLLFFDECSENIKEVSTEVFLVLVHHFAVKQSEYELLQRLQIILRDFSNQLWSHLDFGERTLVVNKLRFFQLFLTQFGPLKRVLLIFDFYFFLLHVLLYSKIWVPLFFPPIEQEGKRKQGWKGLEEEDSREGKGWVEQGWRKEEAEELMRNQGEVWSQKEEEELRMMEEWWKREEGERGRD